MEGEKRPPAVCRVCCSLVSIGTVFIAITFDFADGVITATVILPKEGKGAYERLMETTQDVRNYFGRNHPGLFGPKGPSEEVARDFLQSR